MEATEDNENKEDIENKEETQNDLSVISSISFKLVVILISIAVFIPLAGFGFYSFINFKSIVEKNTLNNATLIAEAYEGILFTYIDAIKNRTVDFSSDGFIRSNTKELNENPQNEVARQELNNHLIRNKMVLDKSIFGINIINNDGIVIASTNDFEISLDDSDEEHYTKTRGLTYGNAVVIDISDVNRFQSKQYAIHTSSILTDRTTGEHLGTIVIYFKINAISQIFSGEWQVALGAISGFRGWVSGIDIYIVNNKGLMVTDQSFLHDGLSENQIVNTEPVRACIKQNREISGKWINYNDVPVFGASMCLPVYFNWTLVVELGESEILKSTNQLSIGLFIVLILIALLTVIIALFIVRSFTNPIQSLIKSIQIIGNGNFKHKIKTNSKGTVGRLATELNKMTTGILEYNDNICKKSEDLEIALQESHESKSDLESVNDLMTGREIKMTELKKEIVDLKTKIMEQENEKTIIPKLVEHHRNLNKKVDEIFEILKNEKVDAKNILRMLELFKQDLMNHLKLENEVFYPNLISNMLNIGQPIEKTEMLIAEMKEIEVKVIAFLEKYATVQPIEKNIEEFKEDFQNIVIILTHRIESEEIGVYSHWGLF